MLTPCFQSSKNRHHYKVEIATPSNLLFYPLTAPRLHANIIQELKNPHDFTPNDTTASKNVKL